MSTKLTYTGAEVQELLDKIEKGDFDNAKTLEGHPASYFAIASEFASLTGSFAAEQGRVNTLHSYFNNGSANDALSLGGQLPSYYATATQYEILQQTLADFKSLFDSMFEKDSDGNIHAKLSLWSSGGITAGGVGSGGSGGGGISYSRLDSWADYSADKSGWVLSALLGKDLDNRVSALANAGYVTASALAPYALRSELPIITKDGLKSTLGISDWALAATKPTYTASEVGALSVNGTAQSALKMTPEYLTDLNNATPWRFFDMNTGYGSTDGNKPNIAWVSGITGTASGSSNYRWQLAMTTGSHHPYFRREHNGNWNNWSALAFTSDIPTKLSQLTNDKINNRLTIDSLGDYTGLRIVNKKELCGIRFSNSNTSDSGNLIYLGGSDYSVTNDGWTRVYKLLHEGNYSNLLANGTINGPITASSFIGNLTGNADSANFVAKTYANENINFAKDESKIRLVSGVASNSTDLGFPKRYTAGLSVVSSYCGWQMVCYGSNIDYNPYYRSVTDKGVWGSWRQIAFLTDNVASATKLATPRTIWGRSFDGTGDIRGHLTNVGNIYSKGAQNGGYVIYSSPRWDEALSIDTTDNYGIWLTIAIVVKTNGNVAIGGTTADEKLHVHGNGKFTGALTANSLTIGGATITYDSVNEALCINGNMYALGGVTAGGAGISAYSSLEARVARIEQQLNIS